MAYATPWEECIVTKCFRLVVYYLVVVVGYGNLVVVNSYAW